jgi:hypothetical protein
MTASSLLLVLHVGVGHAVNHIEAELLGFFLVWFFWWRGLIHSKGARTAAASTPIGPRARL